MCVLVTFIPQSLGYNRCLIKVCYLIEHTLSYSSSLERSSNTVCWGMESYQQFLSFLKAQELHPNNSQDNGQEVDLSQPLSEATSWTLLILLYKTRALP